jgi:hypothetical protein
MVAKNTSPPAAPKTQRPGQIEFSEQGCRRPCRVAPDLADVLGVRRAAGRCGTPEACPGKRRVNSERLNWACCRRPCNRTSDGSHVPWWKRDGEIACPLSLHGPIEPVTERIGGGPTHPATGRRGRASRYLRPSAEPAAGNRPPVHPPPAAPSAKCPGRLAAYNSQVTTKCRMAHELRDCASPQTSSRTNAHASRTSQIACTANVPAKNSRTQADPLGLSI